MHSISVGRETLLYLGYMKNITAGVLPLIGAAIVFGVSIWDSSMTMEAALIILVVLSLYLFLFHKAN